MSVFYHLYLKFGQYKTCESLDGRTKMFHLFVTHMTIRTVYVC